MSRYADPRMCPDCRAALVAAAPRCRVCRLPLQGPLALELFETLTRADVLLDGLRSEARLEERASVPTPAGPAPGPGPDAAPARRTGLRTASVPSILLGLGALCLIVAAVTFLVVTWSWLGVGGRTGVLVGLTLAAAGTGVLLGRRGLLVAAECLTTVSIGLVTLDVVGAISAGWLGTPDFAGSVALVGAGAAGFSGALLSWSRRVVCEVAVTGGLVVASGGIAAASGHHGLVAFVAVLALAGVSALGAVGGARVLAVTSALGAAASWLWLLLLGLERATAAPSLHGLWVSGGALPLVGAAALLVVVGVLPVPTRVSATSLSAAATIATVLVALPALDEGTTAVGLTLLATVAAWSVVGALASRAVAVGPLVLAAVPTLSFVAWHALVAAERVWHLGSPFGSPGGVRLDPAIAEAAPLLLVPLVAALLAATRVLARAHVDPHVGAVLLVAAALATVASYAVPLALLVGLVAATALALARLARPGLASGAVVAMVAMGLPSAGLTTLTCAVAVTVAALFLASRRALPTLLGGLLLPAAAGGLVWSAAEVVGVAVDLRAVPVLVVVGALAIARPRIEVEASAALVALVAAVTSIGVAADRPTALAVLLTVAGALVTLSSLLHQERRVLAWPGGLLLAAATWVRLADLGVEAPEAYTLPAAVVLVLVALRQLWRAPEAGTAMLVPGLTLATLPSLLWVVFVEPTGARAVLLGIACLGLVLAGARMRWSAPLAVGAVVGGLLVVREVAPYGGHVPQWVLIGLAGTVLTVVGVTWEERLLELRRATAYLGRLR